MAKNNTNKSLNIVHINTHDVAGGAAKVAWRLAEAQRKAGHNAVILSGRKNSDSPHAYAFDIEIAPSLHGYCMQNGQLYYDLQGSHKLVDHPVVQAADILHLHNLHGNFFNPFSLSAISHAKPTVWTLHDEQAFTGHCAYTLGCDKWQSGCSGCPNINLEHAINKDSAGQLLCDKKTVYDNSHFGVITPSRWLKERAEAGILGGHPVELIYNGIDTEIFRPYDKAQARKKFGIPENVLVVGAVANGSTLANHWKGGQYTQAALDSLADKLDNYVFVNIGCGKNSPDGPNIINIPHIKDEATLAQAYSTLDIFLYSPLADNCPLVVLEALCCGIPIVSFDTGGVGELVRHGYNGFIAGFKDVSQLVQGVEKLAGDRVLMQRLAANARKSAVENYEHENIALQYEQHYRHIISEYGPGRQEVKMFAAAEVPEVIKTPAFVQAEKFKQSLASEQSQQQTHPNKIDVSIVVCTKDRAELLDQMLVSLGAAGRGVNFEVIVVAGQCADNTLEILKKHGVSQVYDETEVLGLGRHSWPELYDFGFSRARGKWAMYASDDIVFGKDSLTNAVKTLNGQSDTVAGGVFFYKNVHARADWDQFGIDFTLGSKLLMNYGLVRLAYFQAVNGFDASYKFYCADGDLCLKLYEKGLQLVPLAKSFVIHNNVLDVQKSSNAQAGDADIEYYKKRWEHFVEPAAPKIRRMLWKQEYIDAFELPEELGEINQGVEFFWYGLACLQNGDLESAKLNFLQATQLRCDHWLVLWYLAKAAHKSGDEGIAERAGRAVVALAPEFDEARQFVQQFSSAVQQQVSPEPVKQDEIIMADNNGNVLNQLNELGLWKPGQPLRLHLGCGKWKFPGYVNIDYPPEKYNTAVDLGADIHSDIRELNLPEGSVDEIRLHHVFEHFNRVAALAMLIKWHKCLKIGGSIHIETPDLEGSARTILSDAPLKTKMGVIRHLAGDQAADWAYHVDQWFGERFEDTLKGLGFDNVQLEKTSWDKEPFLSNVEVIAEKTRNITVEEQLQASDKILWQSTVADKEKPTWEVWRKQLRAAVAGEHLEMPSAAKTPDISAAADVADKLVSGGLVASLEEIYNFNTANRNAWVKQKASQIPAGASVLDMGAGTCPYSGYFSHCDYKTHDFKKYEGKKLGGTTEYGRIDYVSDIINIPVEANSFDVILCTEVLEHVPEPIEALREMSRILKLGGKLLITAPLGSGLHQLPYHYYGGYSPQWYRHFMKKFGLETNEITPNGGFFKLMAQECVRVASTLNQNQQLCGDDPSAVLRLFAEQLPQYLYSLDDKCFNDQFTIGYHVEATKLAVPRQNRVVDFQKVSQHGQQVAHPTR